MGVAHNKRDDAGEETWWRKVTPFYDHTHEEFVAIYASGLPAINHTSTNLVDNDDEGSWGAFGCDGAWPQAYFDWVANNNNGYIQTETSYPYEAATRGCRQSSNGNFDGGRVTGMNNKWNTEETGMKELVYTTPVATAIVTSYMGDYGGGVYNDPRCCEQISDSGCKNKVNHEVTAVGYVTREASTT